VLNQPRRVEERHSLSYITDFPSLIKGGDKEGRLLNKYLRGEVDK